MKARHRNFPAQLISLALLGLALAGCLHDDKKAANDTPPVVPAAPITRTAILTGAQEVALLPVVTNAAGYGSVVVDPTTLAITGSITFTGVNASAAHIHTGAAGANGTFFVTLTINAATHSATIPSGTVLTQAQYDDLLAGNLYFNVHSSTNSGGEIRGQIGRVVMQATLNGAQEVPENLLTQAAGTAIVIVDPLTLGITGRATYTGISAANAAAHIHTSAAGANGPIAITLTGNISAGTATIPANTVLTQTQYDDLRAGKLYFNVHNNNLGEIRGQIGPVVMVATPNGAQQVSPVTTTTASGKGVFVVDPVTRTLSGGVGFVGLIASGAHIHTGAIGINSPPGFEVALTVDNNVSTAIVPTGMAVPPTVLDSIQYNNLLTGNLYVNIHSASYPNGEIRGQLGHP